MLVNRIIFCFFLCYVFCIQQSSQTINKNTEINDQRSLKTLVGEACELERNYFELKKSVDVTQLYQRLSNRTERLKSEGLQQDDQNALSHFQKILQFKFKAMNDDYNLILNVTRMAELAVEAIERNNRQISLIRNVNDLELLNDLNKFQFGVCGNLILAKYYHVIEGFQLSYFPFAVDHLEKYQLRTSPTAYNDLNAIVNATTSNLRDLADSINEIQSNSWEITGKKQFIDKSDPDEALYVWKSSDVREEIRKLFEGEKITLSTAVNKQPRDKFNAFKFNTIEFVFRSSVESDNRQLTNTLKAFQIQLNYTGQSSVHRCNNHFYQISTEPVYIFFNFEKTKSNTPVPTAYNAVYGKLRDNQPLLSPYTVWEIQLDELNTKYRTFNDLTQFAAQHEIDIELHATGEYIEENSPICEKGNLNKFYKRIEI